MGLAIQVDTDFLDEFRAKMPETDGTLQATKKFMGALKVEFHPPYYRRLKKLRSQFESTNDVLSAYSVVMSDILHFSTMEKIAIEKKLRSSSDLCRTYRGLWTLYSEILTSLVRLTSNDLRFWLIDAPYVIQAEVWAKKDFQRVMDFFCLPKSGAACLFVFRLRQRKDWKVFGNQFDKVKMCAQPAAAADAACGGAAKRHAVMPPLKVWWLGAVAPQTLR